MNKLLIKPCFIIFLFIFSIPATSFAVSNNKNLKNRAESSKSSNTMTLGTQTNFLAMRDVKDGSESLNLKPLAVLSESDAANKTSADDNFYVVGSTADFPGGEEALKEYFSENVMYPREEKTIRATVIVKFLVDEEGEIEESILMQSVSPNFDRSVLRAIWRFPKWMPAYDVNGNPIKSYVVLPFVFDAI
ncbi:MAG: putative TonB-dependent receptor [Bacteroidetes bacterium]|nr:putative TonB-dependent receptor [Bacteroidota bacterium]